MSTNHTPNLNLHAWTLDDTFSLGEFNDNFSALDAAVAATRSAADAARSDASAALTALGGLRLEYGTYVGDGTYGSANRRVLTFSGQPLWVFIKKFAATSMEYETLTAANGATIATVKTSSGSGSFSLIWGTNSLTIYNGGSARSQLNDASMSYWYLAVVKP